MILEIFNPIISYITSVISGLGYPGIFFLMVVESAMIPVPSEIIMPFSGFLVAAGKLSFVEVGTSRIIWKPGWLYNHILCGYKNRKTFDFKIW